MEKMFDRILYGGDYNPNQWPREVWDEDMRLFRKAGINSASVNIFSWAKIQPSENEYCFDELDDIVEMLRREGMDIVMATSTAALPAWMFKKYPEVARVDFEGRRHKFGHRHNACPHSPVYQKYAGRLASKLAERYGGKNAAAPGSGSAGGSGTAGGAGRVACWHVNNEYSGECYCENCEKAFRVWLKGKYKTIAALNKAWNMEFWGHTVYCWDEVVAPNGLGDGMGQDKASFAGMSIDYMRFMSDSMLENFKMERDAIRAADPGAIVTTNLMGTYKNLDYFKWAKEMDVVSWDNYPAYDTPWSFTAMRHDLMRGLKGRPFMLMEQTPSQQNWQPYNSLKRPGQMRAQSYQTVAHGADTIQFFQLRRSVGACEKFHGAVIEHAGTENARVFREVAELGRELEKLGGLIGAGSPAQVGIIFDWENYWALEYASGPSVELKYVDQIHRYYEYFYDSHIPVDMIPADADFTKYKAVVAPVLYMVRDGMREALEAYVEGGGVLLTGFMSGIVDQSDNVHLGGYPGPLRRLAGIWAEEIDVLPPGRANALRFSDGEEAACGMLCDIVHLEGAASLADYTSDFYAGSPAVTENSFGRGKVFYVGTQPDRRALGKILGAVAETAGFEPITSSETKLEVALRANENGKYYFLINLSGEAQPLPAQFAGERDALTGEGLGAGKVFGPYDVALIHYGA